MSTLHDKSWFDATVVATTMVAEEIKRIELAVPFDVSCKAGEHIDVLLPGAERQLKRSYSIVDADRQAGTVALSVFRTPNSRGGSIMMHTLVPDSRLRVSSPQQDFPLRIGARRYVLLAGGIGITAILSMADTLRRVGANYHLIYVGRHRAAMAYLDRVIADHGEKATIYVDAENKPLNVKQLVAEIDSDTELYMCGPIRLMDAVRRTWHDTDLDITNLRFETFGNSGWFEPEPFTVTVPRLGLTTQVEQDESLLEALERAGADMMFDCRKGECGLCQVKILSLQGRIDHRDVFFSEAQKNEELPATLCCCVSRVSGTDLSPNIELDIP
ncbi:PDR/VanB family oxidoreductase [Micrococcoides hystricis]|uniref:PDR/VanB family oxidoreductase n=1 Tax=Micrococcoides hystricis TaxID=1572761 RepID=A0ABV6P9M6_9MICC